MEHPLIQNIDHLTMEELQSRISDLTKKLSFAHKTGNVQLSNQIRMALETFNTKYKEKIAAMSKSKSGNDLDYSNKINIS